MRAMSPRICSIWFCRSSRLRRSCAFSSVWRCSLCMRIASTRWRRSRMARRASSSSNSAACAPSEAHSKAAARAARSQAETPRIINGRRSRRGGFAPRRPHPYPAPPAFPCRSSRLRSGRRCTPSRASARRTASERFWPSARLYSRPPRSSVWPSMEMWRCGLRLEEAGMAVDQRLELGLDGVAVEVEIHDARDADRALRVLRVRVDGDRRHAAGRATRALAALRSTTGVSLSLVPDEQPAISATMASE